MNDLCFYEGGSWPVCGSVLPLVLELGSFKRCFVFNIEVMDCVELNTLFVCLDCKYLLLDHHDSFIWSCKRLSILWFLEIEYLCSLLVCSIFIVCIPFGKTLYVQLFEQWFMLSQYYQSLVRCNMILHVAFVIFVPRELYSLYH